MSALMDLKTDYAFKQLFGKPETADILRAFLNALLPRDTAEGIVALDIANTEMAPARRLGKGKRLDLYVRTDRGEHINLEIQVGRELAMPKRTLLYWSGLYEAQATSGMDYGQLNRAITVNIVNFVMLPSTARYHTSYHVYEDAERSVLTNVLEMHFVELPKFRRSHRRRLETAAKDPLGRWLLLLDAAKNIRIRNALEEIAMVDPTMDHALSVWEEISRDPEHYADYLSRRKALLDELSREARIRSAASAEQRGLEKGLKQGLEQGMEQGMEQGARKTQRQIARAMLAAGESVERVMKFTGLSAEEIAALQQNEA